MNYPVSDQASNIDETPVHNIGMERQCVLQTDKVRHIECSQQINYLTEKPGAEGWTDPFLQGFQGSSPS